MVEPRNLADSYRRSIRIVPIDCQSKRRDVCTAAQRGRRDVVVSWKFFHWEGEPQRELDTATTTSLRILQLIIQSTASTTSIALPSSRMADNTILHTAPHIATERTVYASGSLWWASHSPSYPAAWTYLRGIPSSSTSLAGDVYRGPRLGP